GSGDEPTGWASRLFAEPEQRTVWAAGLDGSRRARMLAPLIQDDDGMPFVLSLLELDASSIFQSNRTEPDGSPWFTARQSFVLGSFCSDARAVRGELYVDGRLLGEASWNAPGRRSKVGAFVPAWFPELNLAICRPDDWVHVGSERLLRSSPNVLDRNVSGSSLSLARVFLTSAGAPRHSSSTPTQRSASGKIPGDRAMTRGSPRTP